MHYIRSGWPHCADASDGDSVIITDGLGWMDDWYGTTGDGSDRILDQIAVWATDESKAFKEAFTARYGYPPAPSAGLAYDVTGFFIALAEAAYQQSGELSREALYTFVEDELWTGQWSYTNGIMMEAYRFTEASIPDPVVGEGDYLFPIVQYFDGQGKVIFLPSQAEQSFTPPGN